MKFNSQICTSKEQSERLLAMGLKRETADMAIISHPRKNIEWKLPITEVSATTKHTPAWSLHRLIEILGVSKIIFNIDLYDSPFEEIIQRIEIFIKVGEFNKKYFE